MEDNPHYLDYVSQVEKESQYRKELFGDTERTDKNYAHNQKNDSQKRLGNSLLKEMKRKNETVVRNKNIVSTNHRKNNPTTLLMSDNPYYHKESMDEPGRVARNKNDFSKPLVNKKDIYQMKRALNDDYSKDRAEREYEQMQSKIEWEQRRSRL